MRIDILDTFLDLLETRNFNKTAERLGITQSTVSSRIRILEELLNKQMFVRGKSGTEPTAAAIRFYEFARSFKLQWLEACRDIQAMGAFDQLIRIGLASQMYENLIVEWLQWIRDIYPKLSLYIEVDYADQMIQDLLGGTLDLAVLYSPRHLSDLHYEQIADERYLMVSTAESRLAEVKPETYIKANYSVPFGQLHRQLVPQFENSSLAMGNISAIKILLSRRGGTAYVTEAVSRQLCGDGVVQVVGDAPVITHPIYSAVHIRYRNSPVHRRILQGLKEMVGASLTRHA